MDSIKEIGEKYTREINQAIDKFNATSPDVKYNHVKEVEITQKVESKSLEKRVADLEWKLDAVISTQQSLWNDYAERTTKRAIAPLEKFLGCKIWDGFKSKGKE